VPPAAGRYDAAVSSPGTADRTGGSRLSCRLRASALEVASAVSATASASCAAASEVRRLISLLTARAMVASVASSSGRHACGFSSITHMLPSTWPPEDSSGYPAHAPIFIGPTDGWRLVRGSAAASSITNGAPPSPTRK
jgi:hypothetical protein